MDPSTTPEPAIHNRAHLPAAGIKGRTVNMTRAANRAVDDPATLARAARIVRAALARQALTLDDLHGDIVKPADLGQGGVA